MTLAQKERHIAQLRKALGEISALCPHYITPAYIERRLAEECALLNAN